MSAEDSSYPDFVIDQEEAERTIPERDIPKGLFAGVDPEFFVAFGSAYRKIKEMHLLDKMPEDLDEPQDL